MQQVKQFGVLQTAKVVSLIYLIIMAIFFIPVGIIVSIVGSFSGNAGSFPAFIGSGVVMLIAPVFYAVIVFISTAIGCLVYNLIAEKIGGIEIEIKDKAASTANSNVIDG